MSLNCKNIRHRQYFVQKGLIGFFSVFVFATSSFAANSRSPANYMPSDNHIIVPVKADEGRVKTFLKRINDKHEGEILHAKNRIKNWIEQEEYVQAYGLEGTGVVALPTQEQKQRFFERHYMRFIVKDVENRTNSNLEETARGWYESWTASDELDAIEATEERVVKTEGLGEKLGQKKSLVKKELNVGKRKFKFDVQPRLEMGMVKLELRSPYVDARAWLGVNGNQEVRLYKTYEKTRTQAEVNYFIEQKRVLASVNQPLSERISLRLVHDKYEGGSQNSLHSEGMENNFVQLRFGMGF